MDKAGRIAETLHYALRICLIISALLAVAQILKADEINPKPLMLYGLGGAADIWSTSSTPLGYHRLDSSPLGRVAGPIVTMASFAVADMLLQRTKHNGWAKVLRGTYVIGITVLVVHNRGMK